MSQVRMHGCRIYKSLVTTLAFACLVACNNDDPQVVDVSFRDIAFVAD